VIHFRLVEQGRIDPGGGEVAAPGFQVTGANRAGEDQTVPMRLGQRPRRVSDLSVIPSRPPVNIECEL